MASLVCPICPIERTSHLNFNLTQFMKHIKLFHSHQPNFTITCGLHGCLRTFKNFRTFQNHVSNYHAGYAADTSCNTDDNDETRGFDDDSEEQPDHDLDPHLGDSSNGSITLQQSTALFLMGLKEKHKLTQVALQGVIDGATGLMQSRLSSLHAQVSQQLRSSGASEVMISSLSSIFSEDSIMGRPFYGLETQHQQQSFYRNHFHLIVRTFYSCYVLIHL